MTDLPALYVLTGEYLEAAKKLSDMDLPENVVADTLEGLSGELEIKAANVGKFIQNLEVTAEAMKAAEGRLSERRKAVENRMERLKHYLKYNMERTGIRSISSSAFDLELSIRNNPPRVVVDMETRIPEEYWRKPLPPPPAIDKKAIADAIKEGKEVPGAHLETTTRLDIK